VSNGLATAAGMGTQSLLTAALTQHFTSATGRAIWAQGQPSGSEWAWAIPLNALLGAGFGARGVEISNAKLIGSIVDTPFGRGRIATITASGQVVLEPVGGLPVKPPAPPPAIVDLVYDPATGSWQAPSAPGAVPPASQLEPIPGSQEVRLTPDEYAERLAAVYPGQITNPGFELVERVGRQAAANVVNNPDFVQACQQRRWALAGTLFHAEAARVGNSLRANLPSGWRADFELRVMNGASRLDILLRDPAGTQIEIDWKTTGRSAWRRASQLEMTRHAADTAADPSVGNASDEQLSKSWTDFVRPLLPNINWPK
jgi:hypothetical protein